MEERNLQNKWFSIQFSIWKILGAIFWIIAILIMFNLVNFADIQNTVETSISQMIPDNEFLEDITLYLHFFGMPRSDFIIVMVYLLVIYIILRSLASFFDGYIGKSIYYAIPIFFNLFLLIPYAHIHILLMNAFFRLDIQFAFIYFYLVILLFWFFSYFIAMLRFKVKMDILEGWESIE